VIYLIFNEGYAATAGDDWMRPGLCEDALRLGRILAELAPGEPEVHGLVALMEIQASRARARVGPSGEPVLLLDQDRTRWDHLLVRRGLAALARAEALGGTLGPYALQAAIAACHGRARTAAETDWLRIAALYDALAQLTPSPIVDLSRAVASAWPSAPPQGSSNGPLGAEPAGILSPAACVRGVSFGSAPEARAEFERAASSRAAQRERCSGGRRPPTMPLPPLPGRKGEPSSARRRTASWWPPVAEERDGDVEGDGR
jgi:predicted RNA polymerase sigma factor